MSHPQVQLNVPLNVADTATPGVIVLELDDEKAPASTANFLAYVNKGHYDGTVFHRVIKNFMIQGGGFTADMQQKPTDAPIQNEAANGLKNGKYTIAMARTGDPHKVHDCHGPHGRSAQRHGAVLHQRGGQRLPEPHGTHGPGLGLRRLRQGGAGPGRGR